MLRDGHKQVVTDHLKGTARSARPLVRWQHTQQCRTLAIATPHSGYHWEGSARRFFEGWYFKVTIPEVDQSFALIYSIEDPQGGTDLTGTGVQVMGPEDGYVAQYTKSASPFWASPGALELGACFKSSSPAVPKGMIARNTFSSRVQQGFQASATLHQGNIVAQESQAPGQSLSTVDSCSWDFAVEPVYGWGSQDSRQQATAGWLSVLSVFEPHWQVLMAHGLASGWLQWGGKRYNFEAAPAYAEKNWGGGFPSKWCWVQCNTFAGQPNLSLTAVGARRGLLGIPGVEEDVGMIGVHWNGQFIELVPWNGQVSWSVDPWGSWYMRARSGRYEAVVKASCSSVGTVLRAPTATQGLAPFCRDTFEGMCRLQLWEMSPSGARKQLVDVQSSTAALEVGGGPWWGAWSTAADMKEPFRSLVRLPLDVAALSGLLPQQLRPPGL